MNWLRPCFHSGNLTLRHRPGLSLNFTTRVTFIKIFIFIFIFQGINLFGLESAYSSNQCISLFLTDTQYDSLVTKPSGETKSSQIKSPSKTIEQLDALDRSGSPSLVINLSKELIDWQSIHANQLLQIFFQVSEFSKTQVPEAVKNWLQKLSAQNEYSPRDALVVGTRDVNIKLYFKHRSADNRWLIEVRLFDLEWSLNLT